MLTGALTDWPQFMTRCFENLAPGGWLELADITFPTLSDDGTLLPNSPLAQWNEYVIKAGHMLGHSIESAKHYRAQMVEAGFVNVQERLFKWPINAWPKDGRFKEIGESFTFPVVVSSDDRCDRHVDRVQLLRRHLWVECCALYACAGLDGRGAGGLFG